MTKEIEPIGKLQQGTVTELDRLESWKDNTSTLADPARGKNARS